MLVHRACIGRLLAQGSSAAAGAVVSKAVAESDQYRDFLFGSGSLATRHKWRTVPPRALLADNMQSLLLIMAGRFQFFAHIFEGAFRDM